ncbi:MAG: hypothetical protein JWN70_1260 [Planctomycetaceae bacterium]|nr:hypothetical protein [Planctomycetaceae bacterium]
MPSQIDFECLIETLAEHDETLSQSDKPSDSSILVVKADLQLLEASLRRSPPADPFSEESACEQALNLVEAIGRAPSFTTRRQLAADREASPAEQSELPGEGVLGQYHLLQKLGEGGFGAVYKALHSRLDKVVALKVLTTSRLRDRHAVDRFGREMRAVGKLHHINIVAATDAGEIDGMHYLVMELVDGIDLRKLVKQHGRLPIGAACELIRQAAVGLQHVHEHGLVHRDIKPSNLMLTLSQNRDDAPAVKVLDLGLALLDETHLEHVGELTATGQVMGTLEYMAPEQGSDTHAVDIRADIYSLGASLYKLLTGRAPFSSDQYRSPMKLLMALATQSPPTLSDRCPEIPPELEAIVLRMLAKNPADRYSTPHELADALAPFSHPADVRALVDFLATAADGESIDVTAPAFIGTLSTHRLSSPMTGEVTDAAVVSPRTTRQQRMGWWRPASLAMACGICLAAAIYVMQIRTPQGELIVQTEYEGISVKVKLDGREVDDGWSLLKGEKNKQLIRTGLIEIELPAELTGEYTVTPNRVALTKDRQEIVKIERKPHPVAQMARPVPLDAPHPQKLTLAPSALGSEAAVDRDRAAAQSWLKHGGTCTIVLRASGKKIPVPANGRLPNVPFELREASAAPGTICSQDLEPFAGLTGLRSVNLEESKIDAQSIALLSRIPNLRSVRFADSAIWTSDLSGLRDLRFLNAIAINATQVDDDWKFLQELSNLRRLEITRYTEPSVADCQKWSEVPQLRSIRLDGLLTNVMAAKVQARNPLCRVVGRWLDPARNRADGSLNAHVYGAVGIDPVRTAAKVLLPLGFRLSTADRWDLRHELTLVYVKDLRNIDWFNIYTVLVPHHVAFREQDLSTLAYFPFLRLNAVQLPHADTFAKSLPLSLTAEEINFSNSDLTDEGLRHLQRIQEFPVLNVQGTRVTPAGIETFKKDRPACQLVSNFAPPTAVMPVEENPLPPSPPTAPVNHERAGAELWQQRLGRGHLSLINPARAVAFDPFTRLPNEPFYLTAIQSDGVRELTNSDLESLTNLYDLRVISLSGDEIDAGAIPYIKRMPVVICLDLARTRIPTSSLADLRDLPQLHELGISGTTIDDEWKFLHELKATFRIGISNYRPKATDWERLQEVPQLRLIHFDDNNVDIAAVAELQRRNPLCQVLAGSSPPRVIGVDPQREAVRQLAARKIGFHISVDPRISQGSTVQEVLDNPSRFYVDLLEFRPLAGHPTIDREVLRPVAAIPYNELIFRSGGISADDFIAALPDDLRGQRINFADTDLTDQGLLRLSRISRPTTLIIYNTKVTREGINAYQKAVPHCLIRGNL